jgi:Ca-activated chloride channel family protein
MPEHKPTVSDQSGHVRMTTRVSHPYLLAGHNQKVVMEVQLEGLGKERLVAAPPLALALVIDRSGSMSGSKLQQAKLAASRLVVAMRTGDELSVITYGSDVTTLVPRTRIDDSSKRRILQAIDRIVDRGGTFLSGGLEEGIRQLRERSDSRPARVILISDGQANEGIVSRPGLTAIARRAASDGISVTAIGLGVEFNEKLMMALADHGNGHYHYAPKAQTLSSLFRRELTTLTQAVARRPRLHIDLDPSVSLFALHGYEYIKRGNSLLVSLPDIYAGQKRRVTLSFNVTGSLPRTALARTRLLFEDVALARGAVIEKRDVSKVSNQRSVVDAHLDKQVLARGEQVELAADVNKALDRYDRGDALGARSSIARRIRQARMINSRLRDDSLRRSIIRMKRMSKKFGAAPDSLEGRAALKSGRSALYKLAK